MRDFDFDQIIDRSGTQSIKWDRFPKDVLPLWVADMDFLSPPEMIQALVKRVEHGVFGYTTAGDDLNELICVRMKERYGWEIKPEALVFMPGVVSGLNLFCYTFSSYSQRVVVQTPVYPPILRAPDICHLNRVEVPLVRLEDGRYEIDFDCFEEGIRGGPTQFILCNPHNPTGRVFTIQELQRIAEICLRHQVILCSDEIHSDLIFTGNKHTPIASLSREIEEHTITFIAPSKTFNVAGLGCSVAIIPNPELRKQFSLVKDAFAGHVNLFGLTAARAAYRDGEEWSKSLLGYLESNRNLVTGFVLERLPGIKVYPPEGTYLAWLDCTSLDLPSDPCEFFLQEARVGLNNGMDFGEPGKGFVRLNFGCTRKLLSEALERMERALIQWSSSRDK